MPFQREARASNVTPHRFCELSSGGQVLVATMRRVGFGRFEFLRICNGDPVFDPPPRLVRVSRIGSSQEPDLLESADWILKVPIRDLFKEFARLQNGTIDRIEFRRGLPCLVEVTIATLQPPERDVDRCEQ